MLNTVFLLSLKVFHSRFVKVSSWNQCIKKLKDHNSFATMTPDCTVLPTCFLFFLYPTFDNYNWKRINFSVIFRLHSGTRIIHVLSDASCSGPKTPTVALMMTRGVSTQWDQSKKCRVSCSQYLERLRCQASEKGRTRSAGGVYSIRRTGFFTASILVVNLP